MQDENGGRGNRPRKEAAAGDHRWAKIYSSEEDRSGPAVHL